MIDAALAGRIRMVGLDVDGVLTDGGIYLGSVNDSAGSEPHIAPFELKRYDIQDGLGVLFLRMAGIKVVICTGRVSESVRMRAAELDVDDLAQDAQARKLPALRQILARHGVAELECAFIGDDFPDMGILRVVGLPVAVGNAVAEVREVCRVHLERCGGRGAVREFAERLLKARGQWEEVTQRYERERSMDTAGSAA